MTPSTGQRGHVSQQAELCPCCKRGMDWIPSEMWVRAYIVCARQVLNALRHGVVVDEDFVSALMKSVTGNDSRLTDDEWLKLIETTYPSDP